MLPPPLRTEQVPKLWPCKTWLETRSLRDFSCWHSAVAALCCCCTLLLLLLPPALEQDYLVLRGVRLRTTFSDCRLCISSFNGPHWCLRQLLPPRRTETPARKVSRPPATLELIAPMFCCSYMSVPAGAGRREGGCLRCVEEEEEKEGEGKEVRMMTVRRERQGFRGKG